MKSDDYIDKSIPMETVLKLIKIKTKKADENHGDN